MYFKDKDFNEGAEIARLLTKVEKMDELYFHQISDEIYKYQPFFLTVLLGYRSDISLDELGEIMNMYFLTWEYFKSNKSILVKKVTKSDFENIQMKNIQMLKYSEGESSPQDMSLVFTDDLQNLKSKALFGAIILKVLENPVLSAMDMQLKGYILIDIKSFIECFESIT
jgi:hypothetical protein